MPIYEFYCKTCNTIFNFFSPRVNTEKVPQCPKCKGGLKRQMSTFATIGKAREQSGDPFSDLDEAKMERVFGELASEAENLNEEDPRQMANLMKRFTEKAGLNLNDDMKEALARMEAGEDPEKIEQEMGDIFEGEDPMALFAKKAKKGSGRTEPFHDKKLYEL